LLAFAPVSSFQVEKGAAATAYSPFGYSLFPTNEEGAPANGWRDKTWGAIGDSTTAQGRWQPGVIARQGLIASNFGIAGTRISGSAADAMWQDARINAMPATLDLVTVQGGINDWAQNVALGAESSTNTGDFNGALNVMIDKLTTRFPAKRILLATPTYAERTDWASFGWPNAYTNTAGLTTASYADAVRKACVRWNLPLVDLIQDCGWNRINILSYMQNTSDLIHFFGLGADRVAEVYNGVLDGLPPSV